MRLWFARLSFALVVVSLGACASAPPTGHFVESARESLPPRDAAAANWSAFDRYRDPALNTYVASVLGRLAKATGHNRPPPKLIIVNSPVVNASAASSGEISLTLGLLTLLNDEAELAAILAHELAHVDLGHLDRERRGDPTSLDLDAYREQAGEIAAESRARESAADARGQRVLEAAGYDAAGLRRALGSFAAVSGEHDDKGGYFATHPSDAERIRALPGSGDGERRAEAYLKAISGAPFVAPNRAARPIGRDVAIDALGLKFRPPAGYRVVHSGAAVALFSTLTGTRISISVSSEPPISLEQDLRSRAEAAAHGGGLGRLHSIHHYRDFGGRPAITSLAPVIIEGRHVGEARLTVIEGDRRRFFALSLYRRGMREKVSATLRELSLSIRPLADDERAERDALRLDIVTARADETPKRLLDRVGAHETPLDVFLIINDLKAGAAIEAGRRVKTARRAGAG